MNLTLKIAWLYSISDSLICQTLIVFLINSHRLLMKHHYHYRVKRALTLAVMRARARVRERERER